MSTTIVAMPKPESDGSAHAETFGRTGKVISIQQTDEAAVRSHQEDSANPLRAREPAGTLAAGLNRLRAEMDAKRVNTKLALQGE